MGRQAVQQLPLSQDQEHSEALVQETSAVDKLESEYAVELDFGGTSTSQVLLDIKSSWHLCMQSRLRDSPYSCYDAFA